MGTIVFMVYNVEIRICGKDWTHAVYFFSLSDWTTASRPVGDGLVLVQSLTSEVKRRKPPLEWAKIAIRKKCNHSFN
jgi:hypothetical protein